MAADTADVGAEEGEEEGANPGSCKEHANTASHARQTAELSFQPVQSESCGIIQNRHAQPGLEWLGRHGRGEGASGADCLYVRRHCKQGFDKASDREHQATQWCRSASLGSRNPCPQTDATVAWQTVGQLAGKLAIMTVSLADEGADSEARGSGVPAGIDAGRLAALLGPESDEKGRSLAVVPVEASAIVPCVRTVRLQVKWCSQHAPCSVTDGATRKASVLVRDGVVQILHGTWQEITRVRGTTA